MNGCIRKRTGHYVQTGNQKDRNLRLDIMSKQNMEGTMGKEAKTEIVKIRMTAKEKAELQKLAGQHCMNMSDYIRRVSARPPNVTRDEFEDSVTRVIYEINKIGVNINQIAKKYNENRYVKPSAELLRLLEKTNELLRSITSFYYKRG